MSETEIAKQVREDFAKRGNTFAVKAKPLSYADSGHYSQLLKTLLVLRFC